MCNDHEPRKRSPLDTVYRWYHVVFGIAWGAFLIYMLGRTGGFW
jgi:hypothetical protein